MPLKLALFVCHAATSVHRLFHSTKAKTASAYRKPRTKLEVRSDESMEKIKSGDRKVTGRSQVTSGSGKENPTPVGVFGQCIAIRNASTSWQKHRATLEKSVHFACSV